AAAEAPRLPARAPWVEEAPPHAAVLLRPRHAVEARLRQRVPVLLREDLLVVGLAQRDPVDSLVEHLAHVGAQLILLRRELEQHVSLPSFVCQLNRSPRRTSPAASRSQVAAESGSPRSSNFFTFWDS